MGGMKVERGVVRGIYWQASHWCFTNVDVLYIPMKCYEAVFLRVFVWDVISDC